MASYLTLIEFTSLTTLPAAHIDELEDVAAGFLDGQLEVYSSRIDAQLRKRYAAPFSSPYPVMVRLWLARLVTVPAWLKRGVDATDEQFQEIVKDRDAAILEIEAAANSVDGLYDLPLLPSNASGISRGGPRSYSEASPYVAYDVQRDTSVNEDQNGTGTRR